jgi:outer membrane protein OmpA-like peptidoglycan-associated protein
LNSSAPTATTTPRNRVDASQRLRPSQSEPKACCVGGLRTFALVAAMLALAACAVPRTRAPVPAPPAKPPRSVPAAPAADIAALDPRSYEQDKNRIKLALAKNSRNSLASSEVGYYMDVLQARLKQVAGKSIGVGRQGDRVVLDLSGRLAFESGSAQITPGIREILMPLTKVLVEYRKTLVSVQVRADDSGVPAINPQVAELRVLAVAHYLAEAGVAGKRIVIARSGLNRPPAANVSPENRTRMELQLEPIVRAGGGER